jgi:hypothetical protein
MNRPPFMLHEDFIETGFEQRFQGLLRLSWRERTWHVIGAVPGSGKSLGIADLLRRSGGGKAMDGTTHLPIVAIRAPKNDSREVALGMALSAAFGVTPQMPWYRRRVWLVEAMARMQVECLIIDDAHDLTLSHLAYLKELTDNLAALPYERRIGLGLVTAMNGSTIPLKEIFGRPETLWRQFRRRLDTDRPFVIIQGHTAEEVGDILATYDALYCDQIPSLCLNRWSASISQWLTHPVLDPERTGRVTMDHLVRLTASVLRKTYAKGTDDIEMETLQATAEFMILRRDDVLQVDAAECVGEQEATS